MNCGSFQAQMNQMASVCVNEQQSDRKAAPLLGLMHSFISNIFLCRATRCILEVIYHCYLTAEGEKTKSVLTPKRNRCKANFQIIYVKTR